MDSTKTSSAREQAQNIVDSYYKMPDVLVTIIANLIEEIAILEEGE